MNRTTRGSLVMLGGFLVHLSLGNIFTFGNANTYLTSYLRMKVDPSTSYTQTVWVGAMLAAGQGSLMWLGGALGRRWGTRTATLLGSAITSGGVMLTYWTVQTSKLLTILSYGLITGLGVSLAYAPPLIAGFQWFPNRRGLVSGVVVGGFGLGAVVFNPIMTFFVNPEDHPLDSDGYFSKMEVLDRVPNLFLLLSSVYIGLQVIGIALLADVPDDDLSDEKAGQQKESTMDVEWSQMVRSPTFHMLWATAVIVSLPTYLITSVYKTFGQSFLTSDDHFLATMGTVAGACNAIGRMAWGIVCDHFTYKKCMLTLTATLTALLASFWLSPMLGRTFFAAWLLLIYCTFSGFYSLMPVACTSSFGQKHAANNYGLLFTFAAVSGPSAALLTNVVAPKLGYKGLFLLMAGSSLIGFVMTCFYPPRACHCCSPAVVKDSHKENGVACNSETVTTHL